MVGVLQCRLHHIPPHAGARFWRGVCFSTIMMQSALDTHDQRISVIESQMQRLSNNLTTMNGNVSTNLQHYHTTILSHTEQLQNIQTGQAEAATRLTNTTSTMNSMNENIAKISSSISQPNQSFPELPKQKSHAIITAPTLAITTTSSTNHSFRSI